MFLKILYNFLTFKCTLFSNSTIPKTLSTTIFNGFYHTYLCRPRTLIELFSLSHRPANTSRGILKPAIHQHVLIRRIVWHRKSNMSPQAVYKTLAKWNGSAIKLRPVNLIVIQFEFPLRTGFLWGLTKGHRRSGFWGDCSTRWI